MCKYYGEGRKRKDDMTDVGKSSFLFGQDVG